MEVPRTRIVPSTPKPPNCFPQIPILTKARTLFQIEIVSGISMKALSAFPKEEEVLCYPGPWGLWDRLSWV